MAKICTVSAFHLDESRVHHIILWRGGKLRQYLVDETRYRTVARAIRDSDQWSVEPHAVGAGWIARRQSDG